MSRGVVIHKKVHVPGMKRSRVNPGAFIPIGAESYADHPGHTKGPHAKLIQEQGKQLIEQDLMIKTLAARLAELEQKVSAQQ